MAQPGGHAAFQLPLLDTPHPWLVHLIRDSADSDTRQALFQTCSVLKQLVLQASGHAMLTIDLDLDGPELLKAIQAASGDLTTRGAKSTEMVMVQDEVHPQSAFLAMGLFASHGGRAVTHFTTTWPFLSHFTEHQCRAFLSTAASALPNLTTLNLDMLSTTLPPPSQLPHLTDLTVTLPEDAARSTTALSSVAPYLPQLVRLTVNHAQGALDDGGWHNLFTQLSPTLTHFTTNRFLTEMLLPLLVQYTPSLTHLACAGTLLAGQDFSSDTWALRSLTVRGDGYTSSWAALPQHPDILDIYLSDNKTNVFVTVQAEQGVKGVTEAEARRFPTWRLHHVKEIRLNRYGADPMIDAAAVTSAVQQLTTVQLVDSEGWRVGLENITWTPATAQALKTAVAAHPQLTLRVRPGTLTDDILDTLLQHGPEQGYQMALDDIDLRSNAHRSRPWPWQLFRVYTDLSVLKFARLPDPAEKLRRIDLWPWCNLVFDLRTDEVDSGLLEQLTNKLRWLEFHAEGGAVELRVVGVGVPVDHQPACLRTNLGLLHHVKVSKESKVSVVLSGWILNKQVMAALSALPHWDTELHLDVGEPDIDDPQAVSYYEVAVHVPHSYPTWRLKASALMPFLLGELFQGLSRHRPAALGPVKVVVEYGDQHSWRVGDMRHWLSRLEYMDWGKVVVEYVHESA